MAPARSSYEAIARGAAIDPAKQGLSLPPNSPYANFLAKSGVADVEGVRDDPNT